MENRTAMGAEPRAYREDAQRQLAAKLQTLYLRWLWVKYGAECFGTSKS